MLETLKALADPTRLRLLAVLSRGEFTVQELTAILAMGQSRISRHLKILVAAGLLSVKRQGTWGYYRLGEENPFFREIWPSLDSRLEALPERRRDLDGVARVLETRRSRSREFFDRHARQWDELARTLLPVADYLTPLLEAIPPCATLLEVGVGTGALLGSLRLAADSVIGVDHSPAMLDEARNRLAAEDLAGVALRLGEMAHLPLSDGEAQVAILNMVLHHAPQPSAVLAELARVLAPGGTLLIADLARHEKEWVREQMADQWLGFEAEELQGWLTTAGFDGADCRLVAGSGDAQGVLICRALRR
ncbi:transcriptional regulator, ArsR family [Desulfuromonas soudanensis]|uniref:Transcriptional regulator, ArsR family n=1 Tax=Desulfuromonas soudanensis TaxID=1603606 RepID=A0A0M4CW35_9BACT|nr:metalloregulator ArsR/SmtB family transcription factor [Desulfuromonas soudanensis]ALC16104.1 transcriptional regulator, ArsR family [Desulfuromonas soudanensis]